MNLKEKTLEQTMTQYCYEQIEEQIINGKLAPGKKLKVEALKKELSVGHTPIREALSRLTASGLVDAHDNRGFSVAQVSEKDIFDVYQIFFDIEMLALRKAITLGDDTWEAEIVATLHKLEIIETKKPLDEKIWVERNYAFHVALIAGCNSPLLLSLRETVYRQFDRYCRLAFQTRKETLEVNHTEHKKLAQAVLSRDFDQAYKLMHHHIFDAQKDVISLLKQRSLL